MSEQNAVRNELSLAQENAALRSRVAVLEEELALIREQLAWLKKQVFGRKTEQSSVIIDNGQELTLFQDEQGQPTKPAEETITVPVHKRKKKRTHDEWMSKLPVEEIEHKEEHPICENCGAEMKEMRDMLGVSVPDDQAAHIRMLQVSLRESDQRISFLEQERNSPYRGFFYSSQEKQAWVMRMLEEMDIPYRETDNGFEAQECYVQLIRRLEKEYKAPRSAQRGKLREDIDRLLMITFLQPSKKK